MSSSADLTPPGGEAPGQRPPGTALALAGRPALEGVALMAQGVPKAVIEMLRRVPLLSACTQAELRQIANLGTHVSVPDGKVLIQQGKVGREFFMLLGGRALCYVDGALMATFEPGDFFGEMALLRRSPRQATVVADGGVDLLILDGREFDKLLSTSPRVAMSLLEAMAMRQEANATLYS